ncbi:MAG TPA: hypothetical protein VNO52_19035 [Methylomirabilota bacterium]|nr:hypothetical protein [Methylomirabilota bacterium]
MLHRVALTLALCCLAASLRAATWSLVGATGTWRFLRGTNETSLPNTAAWRAAGFNDAAFANASAPFWYDDVRPGGTQLTDMANRYGSIFHGKTFTVSNPAEIGALTLEAYCDDGYIAWINGVAVVRYNVGAGNPTINTFALGAASEPVPVIANATSAENSRWIPSGTGT